MTEDNSPQRTVHCADAMEWLAQAGTLEGCSVITSLPDVSELGGTKLDEWKRWFGEAATRVLRALPDDGVAIFFQTDIKKFGTWIDKGYLVTRAAEEVGASMLWHKIVCRRPPGSVTFGRPAYSHMLCFARSVRDDLSRSTADVLPDAGEMTWVRAMGIEACAAAVRWIQQHTQSRTIVDPFCGVGTALAVANQLGMDSVGVELSRKRARQARLLAVRLPSEVAPSAGQDLTGERDAGDGTSDGAARPGVGDDRAGPGGD